MLHILLYWMAAPLFNQLLNKQQFPRFQLLELINLLTSIRYYCSMRISAQYSLYVMKYSTTSDSSGRCILVCCGHCEALSTFRRAQIPWRQWHLHTKAEYMVDHKWFTSNCDRATQTRTQQAREQWLVSTHACMFFIFLDCYSVSQK